MTASELSRFVAVAALAAVASPRTADACSRRAVAGVSGFVVLPSNAAVVPRSTLIWVHQEGLALSSNSSAAVRLVDSSGALVPTDETTISVSGEATESLLVLRPRGLLDANRAYEVQVGTTRHSVFSTNDVVDTEAPAAPVASVKKVTAEYFGLQSCGNPSLVEVTLSRPADIAFILTTGHFTVPLPPSAIAVGTGTGLSAVALAPGAQSYDVAEYDLSGNSAVTGNGLSVTVPARTSGCSTMGAFPLVVLAVLVLRRRS